MERINLELDSADQKEEDRHMSFGHRSEWINKKLEREKK